MFDLQEIGIEIVRELSSLIDENVLVTDKNGLIIASTDSTRLNAFHEGASVSMKNQQKLHMTEEMCKKLKGVRPGVVMPIIISHMPIGVIGVTGKPLEVEKYTKLVKRVVELFITDFMSRQEKEKDIREAEFFFFDLVTSEASIEDVENRAKMINLDISKYNCVILLQTWQQFELADVEHLQNIQTIHPDAKILRWGLERVVIISPSVSKQQLRESLEKLSERIGKMTGRKVAVGIGKTLTYEMLKDSFRQAETAVAVSIKREQITFEEDLKLELLYYSIPKEVQQEYIQRTIEPLLKDTELIDTLEAWIQKRGSLRTVADQLHIHRNTLSYRLNKIEALLDIELDNADDFAVIYTALKLLRRK